MATHVSPEAQMFFIYDHTYLQKEEDDLKDAIIYFAPNTVDINEQCALCGQLMGMVGFFKHFTGTTPKFFRLRTEVFVVKHVGKYTLAMAGDLQEPEASLKKKLDNLYTCFVFFMGNLELLFQLCDGERDKFVSSMQAVWDCYLPFSRFYGDAVSAAFESLPVIELPKSGSNLFVKASSLLQASQRRPGVLAGCLLFKNRVLVTQLSQDLTARLLLIKPQQSHLPCQIYEPDFSLPKGVRILSVYLTVEEFFSVTPWLTKVGRRHYATTDFRKIARDIRYSAGIDVFRSSSAGSQGTVGSSTDTGSDSSKSPPGCGNNMSDSVTEITCTLCNTPVQGGCDSEHNADELRNSAGSVQRMVQLQRMRDTSPSMSDYSSVFNSPQSVSSTSSNCDVQGQKEECERQLADEENCKDSKRQTCINLVKERFDLAQPSSGDKLIPSEADEKDQSRVSFISTDSEVSFAEVTTEPSVGKTLESHSNNNRRDTTDACIKDTTTEPSVGKNLESHSDNNEKDTTDACSKDSTTEPSVGKTLESHSNNNQQDNTDDSCKDSTETILFSSVKEEEEKGNIEESVLLLDTVDKVEANFNNEGAPAHTDSSSLCGQDGSSPPPNSGEETMHNVTTGILAHDCGMVLSDKFQIPQNKGSMVCDEGNVKQGDSSQKDQVEKNASTDSLMCEENYAEQINSLHDAEDQVLSQDNEGLSPEEKSVSWGAEHISPFNSPDKQVMLHSSDSSSCVEHSGSQDEQNLSQNGPKDPSPAGCDTVTFETSSENEVAILDNSNEVVCSENSVEDEEKTDGVQYDEVGVDISDLHISSKSTSNDFIQNPDAFKREKHEIEGQRHSANKEGKGSELTATDSPQISLKTPSFERQPSRNSQDGKRTFHRQNSKKSLGGTKERPSMFERQSSRRSQDGSSRCPPGVLSANKAGGKELPGLENVTLYIQGHSDMVLVLLMDKEARQDSATMQALWKYALPHLADLEVQLKGCVKDAPRPISDGTYNFLRYDSFQRSLKGTIVNPVSSLENEFYDGACLMHEEFQKSGTVRDITLRNQTCCIYGHQNINDETYFQMLNVPRGMQWGVDPMAVIEVKAKKVLHQDHNICLL
ncbi:uncharacterized protein LOC106172512 [Lingula anatina]|uniref:Uncharacterized protein LOC106172512 n=1 Tax=Lingula anatina TaxID=7574 RepID=A0A1S3JE72_LINAN|nr:uncharacterized protein LOC106172512 [Lingula anatina]|eukprot:XP_013408715.1 uncharacterized protein LOC106172512 [Lingula anatina]